MIQGLCFQMSSDALTKHLQGRVAHHSKRAAFFVEEIKRFKENAADSEIKEGQNTMLRTTEQLGRQQDFHQLAAEYFTALVPLVIPEETYILSKEELDHIEWVKGRPYAPPY